MEYGHYMRLSEERRKEVGGMGKYLADRGVHHIEVWRLGDLRNKKELDGSTLEGVYFAMKNMNTLRQGTLETITNINQKAKVAQILDLEAANYIVENFIREVMTSSSLLLGLSSIRSADEYTSTPFPERLHFVHISG